MTLHRGTKGGPGAGLLRWIGAAILLLSIACTSIYSNHGYAPSDTDLALLKVGVDTRESVGATIGRPSASGLLNDVGWFYVESRWKTVGGREPQEISREVVVITFTDKGVVANIERFGLEKGMIVPLSRRVTEPDVKGQSFLRQLFGNIGAVNTGDLLK